MFRVYPSMLHRQRQRPIFVVVFIATAAATTATTYWRPNIVGLHHLADRGPPIHTTDAAASIPLRLRHLEEHTSPVPL